MFNNEIIDDDKVFNGEFQSIKLNIFIIFLLLRFEDVVDESFEKNTHKTI